MSRRSSISLENLDALPDDQFQALLLEGVSRTFALTIPQLPKPVCQVVANGYLLCRIVDTIEDEATLDHTTKRHFCEQFIRVTQGKADPLEFSRALSPQLSQQTLPAEHELIRQVPRVIAITHSFAPTDRRALVLCIDIMSQGMAYYQDTDLHAGLKTLAEMNRYCYFVAGVVGEMLTRVFCNYSPVIAQNRERMMALAVSFGQGLQMTNILKDIWNDKQRNVCWLPRDIFSACGFDLENLTPGHRDPRFVAGLNQLIAIAHGHLRNALEYTLLIPDYETGLRDFCLWALGMAVLNLRKIHQNPYFSHSEEAKISRRSVKATVLTTRLCHRSDALLKGLFHIASMGLPGPAEAELLDLSSASMTPIPE